MSFFLDFGWLRPAHTNPVRVVRTEHATMLRSIVQFASPDDPDGEDMLAATENAWVAYKPLREYSGLFLTLADTPQTPQGAVAFAKRFGLLWGGNGGHVTAWLPTPLYRRGSEPFADKENLLAVEPVAHWLGAINRLSEPVQAWKNLEMGLSKGRASDEFRRQIKEVVSQQVSWFGHLRARVVDGQIVATPETLLAAVWLQFGEAVLQGKRFQQCKLEDCPNGRWFEIGAGVKAGGKRDDADFCSPQCRHKHYRNRKADAKKLRQQGLTDYEIARRLKTTRDVIRGWLKSQKRGS